MAEDQAAHQPEGPASLPTPENNNSGPEVPHENPFAQERPGLNEELEKIAKGLNDGTLDPDAELRELAAAENQEGKFGEAPEEPVLEAIPPKPDVADKTDSDEQTTPELTDDADEQPTQGNDTQQTTQPSSTEGANGSQTEQTDTNTTSSYEQHDDNSSGPEDTSKPNSQTTPQPQPANAPEQQNSPATETESKDKVQDVMERMQELNPDFDANSEEAKQLAQDILNNPEQADEIMKVLDDTKKNAENLAAELKATTGRDWDVVNLTTGMSAQVIEQYMSQLNGEQTADQDDPAMAEALQKRSKILMILKGIWKVTKFTTVITSKAAYQTTLISADTTGKALKMPV